MIVKLALAIAVGAILLSNDAYAQSGALSGTFMRGPVRQMNSYDIECHDDTYHLSFEETRSKRKQSKVRLIRLTRASKNIPVELFNEAAQLFDEFQYISSINYSCGLGSKHDDSDEMTPRKFLSISIEGGHKESFKVSTSLPCAGQGDDPDTGRQTRRHRSRRAPAPGKFRRRAAASHQRRVPRTPCRPGPGCASSGL